MKKLQTKMILIFTALVAISLVTTQVALFIQVNNKLQEGVKTESQLIVKNISEQLNYTLSTIDIDIARYVESEIIRTAFKDETKETAKEKIMDEFEIYADKYQHIASIYMGTKEKAFMTSYDRGRSHPADYDPTSRDWYKDALKAGGKIAWGTPYEDVASKELVVTASRAIMSADGKEVLGVIAVDCSLAGIQTMIKEMDIAHGGQAFIIDSVNKAVAYPEKNGQDVAGEPLVQALQNSKNAIFKSQLNDKEVEVHTLHLDKYGWNIGVIYPVEKLQEALNEFKIISVIIGVVALLITTAIVYFVAIRIAKPIRTLSEEVEKMADGDLTVRLESESKDEVGQLTRNFTDMVEQMNEMVRSIQQNVSSVEDASGQVSNLTQETIATSKEIASAMDSVANNATHQANEIEGILGRMERMSQSVTGVNNSVISMDKLSSEVDMSSQEGMNKLRELSATSREANGQLHEVENVMNQLVERVHMISNVMETIRSISDQTNLLALNASIEAARAGEHGKGFAVVATEVRKLAEQSKEATEHVSITIKGIQEETKKAVEAMQHTREMADEQQQSVGNTEQAFQSIIAASERLTESVQEVTKEVDSIAEEQEAFAGVIQVFAAGSQETAAASEEVNASTDEQSTYLQHVMTTSENLQEESKKLKELVERFRV
ncbi:methyl-accepting chemotaxis protein [Priestia taiwanensis]|uniref:Methyl-accepting chemotaxis protein n=1 Tax=Priestia taiwanensis TaxID=1347902 RepID=A0A917ARD2_9BACI|nr:methyl-accepting chemotaxis protein [Priestia taiwanensis]MBM7363851.1 methyl-accepting chemotaxis protein [Priestia taiwanensis]GGE69501.1 methyl-accepting chemotaxis protein [Priestia taiwanensis]